MNPSESQKNVNDLRTAEPEPASRDRNGHVSEEPNAEEDYSLNVGKIITGRLMMVLGLLLILGAGGIYLMNSRISHQAGQTSANMLPGVQEAIAEKVLAEADTEPTIPVHINPYDQEAVKQSNEMTIWEENGWKYIGYLKIPSLNLELPILSEISQYNLGMAPCRHMGSTKSDDLVLAAHNYSFHFGKIGQLAHGDEVRFVDMDGILSNYEVVTVNVIEPTDIEAVKDPALDLVLYTCTYGGQKRVMVGCQRTDKNS